MPGRDNIFFGGSGAQMSYRHAMENLKTPPETRDAGLEGKNRRFQGFLGHTRKNWTKKKLSGEKIKFSQKIKKLKTKHKISPKTHRLSS